MLDNFLALKELQLFSPLEDSPLEDVQVRLSAQRNVCGSDALWLQLPAVKESRRLSQVLTHGLPLPQCCLAHAGRHQRCRDGCSRHCRQLGQLDCCRPEHPGPAWRQYGRQRHRPAGQQ